MNTKEIVLDSCVVIDIMEKPKRAAGLRSQLRGKSIKIILCDVVLREVNRVRGYVSENIISKVENLLGRKIEVQRVETNIVSDAHQLSEQFQICHNGDNKILSLCKAKSLVLVTSDRSLRKVSDWVGVIAFHPSEAAGI